MVEAVICSHVASDRELYTKQFHNWNYAKSPQVNKLTTIYLINVKSQMKFKAHEVRCFTQKFQGAERANANLNQISRTFLPLSNFRRTKQQKKRL